MNRVVLVGRLTKDPILRYTNEGLAVASFTLAVNRTFTNSNGEREADFVNVVVWRKRAENAANFLSKGHLAGVDGRIQTRSYDGEDGKRVFVTEVVADSVQFLEPKNRELRNEQNSQRPNQSNGRQQSQNFNNQSNFNERPFNHDPYGNYGPDDESDGLPF